MRSATAVRERFSHGRIIHSATKAHCTSVSANGNIYTYIRRGGGVCMVYSRRRYYNIITVNVTYRYNIIRNLRIVVYGV